MLGRQQERTAQRDAYEGLLRRLLSEAIKAGAMRPVDVALAGRLILSAINWMHRWYKPDGTFTAAEIAAQYYDMIVGGLAVASPPTERGPVRPRPARKTSLRP